MSNDVWAEINRERNRDKSREAARKSAYDNDYRDSGSNRTDTVNVREAARLPVRDAEDTARRVARDAGGYRKTSRRSGKRQ
jgi:hypothetical protein